MATIENFILRFKVEGQQAVDGIKNSISGLKDDINDFAQYGGPFSNTVNGIIGKLGGVGVAAAAAGLAFAAMGRQAVAFAAQISDVAGATGISEGALLSLRTSVIEAGGSMDDFAQLASKLNMSVNEAAAGNDKLIKAFNDLGVYILDTEGKLRSTEDILVDITEKFQRGELSASQYAAAIDILGKNVSRLDLLKLRAVGDIELTKQIQALDRLAEQWDKFKDAVERQMVAAFGNLTLALEGGFITTLNYAIKQLNVLVGRVLNLPTDAIAKLFNIQNPVGLGDFFLRTAENIPSPTNQPNATVPPPPKPGVSNPVGEQELAKRKAEAEKAAKEAADMELRIFKSTTNEKRDILLQFAQDEEAASRIRADAQIAEARKTITNARELNAKILEIEAARDLEIAKFRNREQEKLDAELKRKAEKLADEVRRLNETAGTQIAQYSAETKLLQDKLGLQQELNELTTLEAERRNKIFEAERDRSRLMALTVNLPPDQRLTREQEINAEFEKRIALINKEADVRARRENDFAAGFRATMRRYEESLTPLKQGEAAANAVFSNMDRSLSNFVNTGKFSFKDFANSVIRDLILIELRASTVSLFKSMFGSLGTALGFRANGGPVAAGNPYVVGERGAELFVPNTAGTIISNSQLQSSGGTGFGSTNVVYNIQAVDASSFRQLVARDPAFIYAVTEQGRKTLPSTRR